MQRERKGPVCLTSKPTLSTAFPGHSAPRLEPRPLGSSVAPYSPSYSYPLTCTEWGQEDLPEVGQVKEESGLMRSKISYHQHAWAIHTELGWHKGTYAAPLPAKSWGWVAVPHSQMLSFVNFPLA